MNFETWTNTIGLLAHTGFGLSFLERKTLLKDRMGNFMAGVTGQIKLSDRIALTGDFTTIPTQNKMLRLTEKSYWFKGFGGVLF
jgi:OOP family OmpA-OmpF porin